jgi:hypothetical protein
MGTSGITVRPGWYTKEDDSAWERVKAAFRRDWRQTKHDFGGNEPDLNQQVGDTVSQASGSESIPPANVRNSRPVKSDTEFHNGATEIYNEDDEPAYQYGYAAYRHYGNGSEWDDDTENLLRDEWGDESAWERKRQAVRRGWTFGKNQEFPEGNEARKKPR